MEDNILYYRRNLDPGAETVFAEDALDYAMNECSLLPGTGFDPDGEFAQMLVEWYFSDWYPFGDKKGEREEWL